MGRKKNKKKKFFERIFGMFTSWYHDLNPETKESVVGLVVVFFAVLSLLARFGKAGALGESFYQLTHFLFGSAFFFLPLVLFLLGFSFLFSIERRFFPSVFFGGFLVFIGSLGLVHVLSRDAFYRPAGFVGHIVSFPVLKLLDVWAGVVFLIILIVIGFLVTLNIPLVRKRTGEKPAKEAKKPQTLPDVSEEPAPVLVLDEEGKHIALEDNEDNEENEDNKDITELLDGEEVAEHLPIPQKTRKSSSALYPDYAYPPLSLLENDKGKPTAGDIKANANIIQRTLEDFGIPVEMGEVHIGPSITQYTLKPAQGVKLSRISALQNDLALALAAHPLRLEAPIPGKSLVGIEIPNRSIAFVGLRGLLNDTRFTQSDALIFPVGRDVQGNGAFINIGTMPHLLIAGSTGSGKSVSIHVLIASLLYKNSPADLRFLMVDPKRVELIHYHDIAHLVSPVVTTAKGAIKALRWATAEMERRYDLLAEARARDITSYNKNTDERLPYIVIIIDELADIMAAHAREIEGSIVRIAQMARAVGIHLIIATQRPSVEVITGLIKANITSRIAFQVASQIDSRTILDSAGAEKLLGNGDMLYQSGDAAKPKRIQGVFITEQEVLRVTDFVRKQADADFEENFNDAAGGGRPTLFGDEEADDELYDAAYELVVNTQKASASYLQRRLRVGYARAARLLDLLEENNVIGPGEGAKPREVLIKKEADSDYENIG